MARPPIASLFPAAMHFVAPILFLTVSYGNAWAMSFDFVEKTSGAILATLRTDASDPFDHTNVTGLSFTTEGDARFGFGVGTFPGMFDSTFAGNRWTSNGVGGLTTVDPAASGILFDDAPPPSAVLFDAATPIFAIRVEPPSLGSMDLVDGTLPDFVDVHGTWRLVPEPSTSALMTLGMTAFVGIGRPRRRRVQVKQEVN